MKWMIINGEYDGANNILLYCRNENKKKEVIKVMGFEPYFYVPHGETKEDFNLMSQTPSEFTSIYGDSLDKIVTRQPMHVKEMRGKFSKHFEADIPFVRRYLIDSKISSGFLVPDDKLVFKSDSLVPVDFNLNPRIVLLDIETYAENRFPRPTDRDAKITVICFFDTYTEKYLSIAIDPSKEDREVIDISENHKAILVPHERDLLELIKQYFETVDPDIITAWNLDFDKTYIEERLKIVRNADIPWVRANVFDLLKAYKTLYAKGSNALVDVVVNEKLNTPNYEPFQNKFWKEDLIKALIVNKSHVEAIVQLNRKLHLLQFYWNLKVLAGFEELGPTLYHGMLVENLLLRWYHNKYILPSKPSEEEKRNREKEKETKVGGKVLEPPFGIFENIGVFDMSRYYPEMLISQNLSPEPHKSDELGIVPKITLWLIDKRLEYDRELGKLTPGSPEWEQMKYIRNSVKYVTESVIGYFGSEPSRVFDLKIFNSVTMMGQRGLIFIQNLMNEEGHKVLYGDTDGLSITMPNVETAIEKVKFLNDCLKDFGRQEGIKRELKLKLDRYFSKIIFKKLWERVNGEWKVRGAKKRYSGRVIFEDGQKVDYLKIVGFEYVRRDSSKVTKRIQPKVFDLMLKGTKEEVKDYLKKAILEIKEGYKNGTITIDDLAIPKTLSKSLEEYGKEKGGETIGIPDYARGSIYANKWFDFGIRSEDQVKMVYVNKIEGGYPKTDVFCYLSLKEIPVKIEVDIEKMIDRNVKGNMEEVIDLIDLKWDDIVKPHKSLFD